MKNLPNIAFLTMIVLAVIVLCVCFFGSSEQVTFATGETFDDPHVSVLLYFVYFELFVAAAVTLISAISSFAVEMKKDSKGAIISLLSVAAIIVVLLITYAIGDGSKMTIIGYEGTDNEGTWAKIADMFLYTSYILIFLAVLAVIASPFMKKIK